MAPLLYQSSIVPRSSNGDTEDAADFISSIATAVGPLILLFGELATKQFLSTSLCLSDNVLLAMGPIGIITVAVSTIRLIGSQWLRALIGRYVPLTSIKKRLLISLLLQIPRGPYTRGAGAAIIDV